MTDKNIVLVGFMGTGKTSVGKILAKKTGRQVVDIDHCIEDAQKRRIADIFEREGEAYFRSLEKEMIRKVSAGRSQVITTGGGAVMDQENLSLLRSGGLLIELTAKPETIHARVKGTRNRPLLKAPDVLGRIRRMLEERGPYYAKADWHFFTDGLSAEQVAEAIVKRLESEPDLEYGKDRS